MSAVPLSILDLSPISSGSDATTALHNTIDLAQHAERCGFRRYWVAEHHFVGVASSSPAVLIGQIAAATNTIRVGRPPFSSGTPLPSPSSKASACSTRSTRTGSIWVWVGPVSAAQMRTNPKAENATAAA